MDKQYSALIVEDEIPILNGMKGALSSSIPEIHEVYTATNGRLALDEVRRSMPSFVIADLCMPVMGGVEFIQNMRKEGFLQPVLVLTALEDFRAAQSLIPCQIENYLVKPFSMQEILDESIRIIRKLQKSEEMDTARRLLDFQPELISDIREAGENSLIRKARQYVMAHLAEPLTLDELASELHLNKAYVSALFKKETGQTTNEFITQQRLRAAKMMLMETNLRIGEICERVGYQSDKYFIQVFRDHEGTTPLVFRQNLRRYIDSRKQE